MSDLMVCRYSGSPPDGTTNHSTKPASGQVAGKPQPSHPQGVRRWVPRCFGATLPQPLKGEGVSRAVVGAPPSGRFAVRSSGVARSGADSPPDGTPNQSIKPASGQVVGKPQPSHPQGVRRRVPRCFGATLPQPLKGEGAFREVVGAPPSGRLCEGSSIVACSGAGAPPPQPSPLEGEGVFVSLHLRGSLLFPA